MAGSATKQLVSALPFPVLLIGPDERIRAANAAVEAIVGPDLNDKHYITAIRQPAILTAIAEARAEAAPSTVRYLHRDGPRDQLYRVSVALAGEDVVLSFEDQTLAQEAGQMRRDFVANVSHELRTPLTALLGFIETLGGAARDDPAARDRFLEIMAHEATRMTRLVDDLLSLSRVEEEERVRPTEEVDLAAILRSVIKGLEPQITAAAVSVELSLAKDSALVPGDAGQLSQVFSNLVENALKYGAAGGQITLTMSAVSQDARLRGPACAVHIADQGEGIADHHIARLTERFYRVDTHRSREVGGTGLGLAIVKHIINRHRGRMSITSAPGQGTTVSVFLPSKAVS